MATFSHCTSSASLLSIRAVSNRLGLCQQTLRRYEKAGRITSKRTLGNHRRYDLQLVREQLGLAEPNGHPKGIRVLLYARVSGARQAKGMKNGDQSDLTRQIDRLKAYSKEHYPGEIPQVWRDIGSGLGENRRSYRALLTKILTHELDNSVLLVTTKDRLSRFSQDTFILICKTHNIEVVFTEEKEELNADENAELTEDLCHIIQSFSSRIYSKRSAQRVKITLCPDDLKELFSLYKQGWSARAIARKFKAEQRTGINGKGETKAVTYYQVRHHLENEFATLSKVMGTEDTPNSFNRFFSACIRQTEKEKGRLNYRNMLKRYGEFCVKHKLEELSGRSVRAILKTMKIEQQLDGNGRTFLYGLQLLKVK